MGVAGEKVGIDLSEPSPRVACGAVTDLDVVLDRNIEQGQRAEDLEEVLSQPGHTSQPHDRREGPFRTRVGVPHPWASWRVQYQLVLLAHVLRTSKRMTVCVSPVVLSLLLHSSPRYSSSVANRALVRSCAHSTTTTTLLRRGSSISNLSPTRLNLNWRPGRDICLFLTCRYRVALADPMGMAWSASMLTALRQSSRLSSPEPLA